MVPHKTMLDNKMIICFKEISDDLVEKDQLNHHHFQITNKEIKKERGLLGNSVQCHNQEMNLNQVQVNISLLGQVQREAAIVHLIMLLIILQTELQKRIPTSLK